MGKFNEWLSKEKNITEHGANDYGMETVEDTDLLENQLSQMADRVIGLLYSLSDDKKTKLMERFIVSLKKRI